MGWPCSGAAAISGPARGHGRLDPGPAAGAPVPSARRGSRRPPAARGAGDGCGMTCALCILFKGTVPRAYRVRLRLPLPDEAGAAHTAPQRKLGQVRVLVLLCVCARAHSPSLPRHPLPPLPAAQRDARALWAALATASARSSTAARVAGSLVLNVVRSCDSGASGVAASASAS
jgi:hypothetical protein